MAELTSGPRPGDPRPGPEGPGPEVPGPEVPGPEVPAQRVRRAHGSEILIVEDQAELVRALDINLRARQYKVATARTGREALAAAVSHPPDAIILDLGLPDIDGTEVIVELRRWCNAPIIVLSGRVSPGDKIGALDVGADDYVTKPFAMAELLARLRAALRRDEGGVSQDRQYQVGQWLIDLTAHHVRRAAADGDDAGGSGTGGSGTGGSGTGGGGGERVTLRLTPTEWRILAVLLDRPGQLVGSAQILTRVWGPGFQQRTNYLRFHMARLRRKLEDNPARPRHLLTEPGMGYRYQP
jgi:two-component system, OmpR family, KDP operon response regulator KdpE